MFTFINYITKECKFKRITTELFYYCREREKFLENLEIRNVFRD
jgi:hypothetical protein